MSLIYDSSHNITSSMDPLNNFLFLNDYGIPFLQTSLENFYYFLGLILSWSQSTGSPNRQYSSLFMTPSYLQTQHVCLFFMCSPNMIFLSMLSLTEAQSLCQTFSDLQALFSTCSFTLLQTTILKIMDKPNTQIRLLSNTSVYIVTTSKTTGLNSYLLWSLPTIMF